ncbi:hypothetical protein NIES37_53460 [Tolypothrix tenuis PCC 7101]|uniref:DUF1802 domain-containing protein n=1 Tax=Tolypothrix tenuis PCC 7101 TaxID=231146 RepID=A0A1Z4N6L6_9CYAN|nr:DUF1802 family protein [Aulosira sp. FACHB-113]BAZ01347.1 hypothetical protein NIES37_53460 [Tolypothrix tenuis PCC 7101]BAZ74730.1 hypothetical protein NIES50_33090 [Aulosira laxa NIES-50]
MNQLFSLPTALCLPVPDIEALIQGRTIAALPRMFLRPGQRFAIYPLDTSTNLLSIEQYYRANFLPIAQTAIKQVNSETISIKAWAKCELCQILDKTKPLDVLSQLTIWRPEAFEAIIQKQQNIFLAYLRIYDLPKICQVTANPNIQEKIGKFVSVSNISGSEDKPVLSDRIFAQRKRQLEKLESPLHPELEELQSAITSLSISQPAAKQLDDDIKVFLGWSSDKLIKQPDPDLAWINDIAKLGDRSIEKDEKKSNYQAGTDFENIARQSLEFLGFKVESAFKGGAGGLDLFCSKPYPIVCECKAGKLIPSRTVEELLKLGGMHLGKTQLLTSAKLVIGPGNPSTDTLKAAKEWEVSIINAMTLQKLVELKSKYPGAINLVELKQYLEPGQIDYKLDEYIDKAEKEIKLRSHIIQLVKNYLQNSGIESAGVDSLHGAYFGSNPPQPLKTQEMHEILIELSSPLTGYLGREKGSDWRSDRFYYLRDLPL